MSLSSISQITAQRKSPTEKADNVLNENAENALELIQHVENYKPSPWSPSMLRLYLLLFPVYLTAGLNGFDGSLMSGVNAIPAYQKYYGMNGAGSSTGILFAIYNIGAVVSVPFLAPLADGWSRRWGIFVGCVFVIVGTCIQAPSTSVGMFMGGRFLIGFGGGFSNLSGANYISEMAHPTWRGTITGFIGPFTFVGMIIAWVAYGTSLLSGELSFRIPLWCQIVCPGICALSIFFLPESPRWLVANCRSEQALRILTKYHGEGHDENVVVKLEMLEMQHQIELDGSDKRWWDYRGLFRTRSGRYRTLCASAFGTFVKAFCR